MGSFISQIVCLMVLMRWFNISNWLFFSFSPNSSWFNNFFRITDLFLYPQLGFLPVSFRKRSFLFLPRQQLFFSIYSIQSLFSLIYSSSIAVFFLQNSAVFYFIVDNSCYFFSPDIRCSVFFPFYSLLGATFNFLSDNGCFWISI